MAHAPATPMTTSTTPADKPRRPGSPPDPHAFQEVHVPVRTYLIIFAGLMLLMLLTVVAAFIPGLGNFGIVIALGIATLKAILVILYFMHVKYASPLVKIFVIAGFVWFFIALGLTFTDYLTRPWLPQSSGWQDHPLRAKTAVPDPVPGEHTTQGGGSAAH